MDELVMSRRYKYFFTEFTQKTDDKVKALIQCKVVICICVMFVTTAAYICCVCDKCRLQFITIYIHCTAQQCMKNVKSLVTFHYNMYVLSLDVMVELSYYLDLLI